MDREVCGQRKLCYQEGVTRGMLTGGEYMGYDQGVWTGCAPSDTPETSEMATKMGGMHPTGMDSCFPYIEFRYLQILSHRKQ